MQKSVVTVRINMPTDQIEGLALHRIRLLLEGQVNNYKT